MQINNLISPLLLTIAIELLAAFLLGYKRRHQISIITLANVITNPALNYILMLLRMTGQYSYFYLLILETVVVFIEWRIMVYAFQKQPKELLILSALMNGASYAAGVLLMGF